MDSTGARRGQGHARQAGRSNPRLRHGGFHARMRLHGLSRHPGRQGAGQRRRRDGRRRRHHDPIFISGKCIGTPIKGTAINYKPAPGQTGEDTVRFRAVSAPANRRPAPSRSSSTGTEIRSSGGESEEARRRPGEFRLRGGSWAKAPWVSWIRIIHIMEIIMK